MNRNSAGWTSIQAALVSKTTSKPQVNNDPKCLWGRDQFIYKSSVSNNADGSGAPAFIFVQYRSLTDPAVIEIPRRG
jgi:hypothetical protein